ncbi:hypothetical protein VTN31DRAFT_5175 [Thermomyces dupontii]|uniref:uncharacterized protein n=1 Tax=Talaromyces thermophilus TaxID=28565 RepID=UPI00374358E5
MTTQQDPFLQVQSEVLSTLQTTRPLFSSFLRIRSLAATNPQNPELQQARAELQTTLQDLAADVADLRESVHAVEQDPDRFGIEQDELDRRRKFVEEVGGEVRRMQAEIETTATSTLATTTTGPGAASGGTSLPNPSEFDEDVDSRGDYYASLEQQRQSELLASQDEQLDGVFRTVGNLRRQASDMGRELEDQAVLLEDVENVADRVGGKLASGMKRIRHIVRKNEDTMSSFCIAVLIFVLFLLLILVIVL